MTMKRFLAVLFLLSISLLPASAQELSLLDWIPADFEGFLRIDMSEPDEALTTLNRALGMVTILQPTRLTVENTLTFDDFFPLTMLDVENVRFQTTILPWLGDELIIAYRNLPSNYRARPDDILVIFSTNDSFAATATLASVIQEQDFLESSTYRGLTIYKGDRASIAFTPVAVLIGSDDVVREALDTEAEGSTALTSDATFQAVWEQMDEDTPLAAYLRGDAAGTSLGYMLGVTEEGAPLLSAMSEAFVDFRRIETVTSALLNGDIDAVGMSLQFVTVVPRSVNATVVVHTPEEGLVETISTFDPAVLEFVPRSAVVVHSGADAKDTAYATLAALPTANFAARILGGFPVIPTTGSLSTLPSPTGENLETAVHSFSDAVEALNGISLFDDVLDHFDGSYSVALLPRPNDPLPIVNTPFDAVLVAQVSDGEAMVDSLSELLEVIVGADNVQTERLDDRTFTTLFVPNTDDPLLRIGMVDDLLLIATGDAARTALDARRGDNRLIEQMRWQAFNAGAPPGLYVDIPAFYNTFLPASGGQIASVQSQIGLHSRSIGNGLYEFQLRVSLPNN